MGKITGKGGKVMYGSVVVAEMTTWSMTGVTMATTTAPTAFADTVKEKEAAEAADPGQLEFSGNYDANSATTQRALAAVCKLGTHLTNLYLYANTSTFWRVGSGGYILVTKGDAITLPRNGYGTVSFSGDVSSAVMEQIGTGT
jgi:hypothetical protein